MSVEAGQIHALVGLNGAGKTTLMRLLLGMLRGYLPGISALLGVVVVTQIVTVLGAGAWFPYAAPGMWSGMGGAETAAGVCPRCSSRCASRWGCWVRWRRHGRGTARRSSEGGHGQLDVTERRGHVEDPLLERYADAVATVEHP